MGEGGAECHPEPVLGADLAQAGGPTRASPAWSWGAGGGKDWAVWACLWPRRSEGKVQESSPRWHPTGDPGMAMGGRGAGRSGKTISFLTGQRWGGGVTYTLAVRSLGNGVGGSGERSRPGQWLPCGHRLGVSKVGRRGEKLVRGQQERALEVGWAGQQEGQMFPTSRFTHLLTYLPFSLLPDGTNLEPSSNFSNKFIVIAVNPSPRQPSWL